MNDEMKEILSDFLAESAEMLEALDQHFVQLESDPNNAELLNEIFRCMHSMKGSAGFLGFTHLVEVAHQGESLLNKLRQGEMAVSQFVIDIILEAVDAVKLLQADIRDTGEDTHVDTNLIVNKLSLAIESGQDMAPPPASDASAPQPKEAEVPADTQPTQAKPRALRSSHDVSDSSPTQEVEASPQPAPPVESSPALSDVLNKMQAAATRTIQAAGQAPAKSSSGKEEDQTVRVETRRLDHVMNLVGELVLGRNRLMKLGFGLEEQYENEPLVRELGMTLAQLNLVTSDLQLAVMKTRMVPIRKVFARFPRLVRDVSNKLGKQVRLELTGEETEVDKSVADELGDPLVHLVRNAMDHGLESGPDRQAKGKMAEGYVRLAASQEGNSIVIRVEDDGRGLPVEKIKAKASNVAW